MERGKSIEREFLSHIYIYIYFAVIDIDDPARIKFFKLFLLIFFLSFDQFIKNDVTTSFVNQFLSFVEKQRIYYLFVHQSESR